MFVLQKTRRTDYVRPEWRGENIGSRLEASPISIRARDRRFLGLRSLRNLYGRSDFNRQLVVCDAEHQRARPRTRIHTRGASGELRVRERFRKNRATSKTLDSGSY